VEHTSNKQFIKPRKAPHFSHRNRCSDGPFATITNSIKVRVQNGYSARYLREVLCRIIWFQSFVLRLIFKNFWPEFGNNSSFHNWYFKPQKTGSVQKHGNSYRVAQSLETFKTEKEVRSSREAWWMETNRCGFTCVCLWFVRCVLFQFRIWGEQICSVSFKFRVMYSYCYKKCTAKLFFIPLNELFLFILTQHMFISIKLNFTHVCATCFALFLGQSKSCGRTYVGRYNINLSDLSENGLNTGSNM
jgi:hypothetical protein